MILDEEQIKQIEQTRKKYEFLTFVLTENDILVGIVQNETPKLLMMYQFDALRDQVSRERFLKYGDEWWWGSNHAVPVNSFIGRRFDEFEPILKGYSRKIITRMIGPTFNLAEKYLKRVKKKRVDIINNGRIS